VYWIEYDGLNAGERVKGREGYFNVDPILRIRDRAPILSSELKALSVEDGGAALQSTDVNIPLDGLIILTVVSKWMGPLTLWTNHFAEARDRGYTMLHYTPLQERGESDSPYSIKDQLRYDPSLFDGKTYADGGRAHIEAILKVAKDDFGLLSLTDVVLNHTANNTAWLNEHPEAGTIAFSFPNRTAIVSSRLQPR
jgi:glycogen debranching enzyme